MSNSINSKTTDIKNLIASQWQVKDKEKHKKMIGSIQYYITSVRKDIGINKDEFICKMKNLKTFTTNLDTANNKTCKSILKIVNDEIIKKTSNSILKKQINQKISNEIQTHHTVAEAIYFKSDNDSITEKSISKIRDKVDKLINELKDDLNDGSVMMLPTLEKLKNIPIKNKDVREKIHAILDDKINRIVNANFLSKEINSAYQEGNTNNQILINDAVDGIETDVGYSNAQLEMPLLIDGLKFPEKTKNYFFQKLNDYKINKGTIQEIKNYLVNQESKIEKNTFASMLYNLASQEIDSMQTLVDEDIVKWAKDSFDPKTNKLEQGSMPDLIGNNGNKSQESTVAKYKLPPIQDLKPLVSPAVIKGVTQQVAPIEPEQVGREAKKPNLFNRMKNSVQGFFSRMVSGLRNIFNTPVAR